MARIAGVDLPREKRVEIGLTYIYGIGKPTAQEILKKACVNPDTRVKDLTEDEAGAIRKIIDADTYEAPEHLELCIDDPVGSLSLVRNAGSVFLGRHCPEAVGDYYAGPNHTLPTGGTARFSSPLSVEDFVKKSAFTYYTADALKKACPDIVTIAEAEGLQAHGRSVSMRCAYNRQGKGETDS